jgi:hypothetical protein
LYLTTAKRITIYNTTFFGKKNRPIISFDYSYIKQENDIVKIETNMTLQGVVEDLLIDDKSASKTIYSSIITFFLERYDKLIFVLDYEFAMSEEIKAKIVGINVDSVETLADKKKVNLTLFAKIV